MHVIRLFKRKGNEMHLVSERTMQYNFSFFTKYNGVRIVSETTVRRHFVRFDISPVQPSHFEICGLSSHYRIFFSLQQNLNYANVFRWEKLCG